MDMIMRIPLIVDEKVDVKLLSNEELLEALTYVKKEFNRRKRIENKIRKLRTKLYRTEMQITHLQKL